MASAVAGPSNSGSGPSGSPGPSATDAPRPVPSHPAFPSLIPRAALPKPRIDLSKDKLPNTSDQLLRLFDDFPTRADIVNEVLPCLVHMTTPKDRDGRDDAEGGEGAGTGMGTGSRSRGKGKGKGADRTEVKGGGPKVEKMMCMPGIHLEKTSDEQLAYQTGPYLFIITARLLSGDPELENSALIDILGRLIMVGDSDQIRACGPRLSTLAWALLDSGKRFKLQQNVLVILHMLLYNHFPEGEGGHLSGAHAAFLHGCLAARQYDMARPFLIRVYIDVRQSQPTYRDVITFFHHAGLISAALGEFESAVEHFSTCVSVPTLAASAIQLAAAKRAYLCGLLHNGKLPQFPKYISPALTRVFEKHLGPYTDLGRHYDSANWSKVLEVANQKVFKDDANVGLVEQVIGSISARRLKLMRETISRLTVGDLMRRLGYQSSAENEQAVLLLLDNLNTTGKLPTAISGSESDGPSRVVTFLRDAIDYDSPAALDKLRRMNDTSVFLDREMRKASREAGVGEAYLRKQMHQLESKADATGFDTSKGDGEGRKIRGVGGNMGDMGF